MNVGYFCTYIPEEIISSCHVHPKFLNPGSVSHNHTAPYLPTAFCPFAKSLLTDLLNDDGNDIDFFLFGGGCDAGKKLYDLFTSLRPNVPCHYLEVPLANTEYALEYYAHSLNQLAQKLLSFQGNSPLDFADHLNQSLELSYHRKKNRSEAFAAGELSGDLLINNTVPSEKNPKTNLAQNIPILFIASHLFIQPIISTLEQKGFLVYDNSALGMRRYIFPGIDYSPKIDALMTLSRWYLMNKVPCPGHSSDRRLTILQQTISGLNLQGVIYFYPKFCDQSLYDLAFLNQHLRIPILAIEHDTSFSSLGQWETRIDAFWEVLSK